MTQISLSQPLPDSQTKRRIDRSALIKSLVVLSVTVGAGYLWYLYSLNRNAKAIFDYAEQCAAKSNYAAAAEQFDRYLSFRPDDAKAHIRLAETYDLAYSRFGRANRTIELYHEALGVAAQEQKTALELRLTELLLATGQFIPAAYQAAAVLHDDPKNVRAVNLQASAFYGQARQGTFKGKLADVGTYFELALTQDPSNGDTALTLARIYREEPRYLSPAAHALRAAQREKAADQIIDQLVAAHRNQAEVYVARYHYRLQYHLSGADDDLQEARRLAPENLVVLLASAEALRREATAISPSSDASDVVPDNATPNSPEGMPAKARSLREAACADYEKAIGIAASDYRGYCGLGETQWELGESQAAIDAWRRGLESAPAAARLFDLLLSGGLVSMGRLDDAEVHLDRLAREFQRLEADQVAVDRNVPARKYQLIRANWLRGKGQPFQAIALAHIVATGNSVTPQEASVTLDAWSLLADTYISIGRWSEAADAFQKAVELAPKLPRYRALAAAAWMQAKHPDHAIFALRQALAFGDGAELRLALAGAIFRQNLLEPRSKRDWRAVRAALADARQAHEKQPLGESWRLSVLEAEIAQAQADAEGRHAEGVRMAADIYRSITLDAKAQKILLPSIAMAFSRLDLRDDALRTINQWEKTVAPQKARLFNAQVAADHKKFEEARRIIESEIDQLTPAERSTGLRFLIRLSISQRDWQKARDEIDSLADFGPGDSDLLLAYAQLAEELKQPAEFERCRKKFIEMEGADSCYSQFLRASSSLAQATSSGGPQLKAARELIDRLTHQYPEWPTGLLLGARLLEIEGRNDEAIDAYRDAIRFGASGVAPYERLIDLLSRASRNSEAETYLDALREQSFAPDDIAALQAQLMARRGDRDEALEIIRREAKQHPKNAAIQLSLGQMLLASGQTAEAVAALEGAVEIAPESVLPIRALAVCFIEIKQPAKARDVLAKLASRKDLPELQKQLAIAEVYEILGDFQDARNHYQAACEVPPPDPVVSLRMVEFLLRSPRKEDPPAGEKLLRAIVLDSPEYAPARRALAGMLAQHGGEESFQEARELLHDSQAPAETLALNRRLDALLLIRRGGSANRHQARQILNELVLHADADGKDRVILAQLEDEDGLTDQARSQFVVMTGRKDPAPDQIVAYAEFLLRHGPLEEAEVQILRLEKLSGDDPTNLALRVRLLHTQHRDGEIGIVLEAAAQRRQKQSTVNTDEKARLCLGIGALYELGEQYTAAERWYRSLLEAQPESFTQLALVLAKQKRGSEAVNVCLDGAKRTPSTASRAAMAVCSMRATSQIDERDFQAASSLVAAAEKEKPEPQFLGMLAAVRIVEDRVDEAIVLYQKVLDVQPQDIHTLNNLATLLGGQPGHAKQAIEYIDRAVKLAGPQSWLLETKGAILLADGRVNEAIALLKESASTAEPDPRVLLHLAQAYRLAGKFDDARKTYDNARKRKLSQQLLTPAERQLMQELDDKLRG